jgi:Mn-containing catalase
VAPCKADGLDNIPVPEAFPLEEEFDEFARTFMVASDGTHSTEGSWASGPAPDGRGDFTSALIEAQGRSLSCRRATRASTARRCSRRPRRCSGRPRTL